MRLIFLSPPPPPPHPPSSEIHVWVLKYIQDPFFCCFGNKIEFNNHYILIFCTKAMIQRYSTRLVFPVSLIMSCVFFHYPVIAYHMELAGNFQNIHFKRFFLSRFSFTTIRKLQNDLRRCGYFFNSSLPIPPTSYRLKHQLGDYHRVLTSAHRQQPDPNHETLVFRHRSLTTIHPK